MRALGPAALLSVVAALLAAPGVVAHPLGNFTINHYSALRVAPGSVVVDHIIDMAEIPAFQERQDIDADTDGILTDAEKDAYLAAACERQRMALRLEVDGVLDHLRLVTSSLTFPPGVGGLDTLRLGCRLEAGLPPTIDHPLTLELEDGSFTERIGWREIVVQGDGSSVATDAPAISVSDALRSYPPDLLTQPPDRRAVSVVVTGGGPSLPPLGALALAPIGSGERADLDQGTPPAGDGRSRPGGIPGATEVDRLVSAPELTASVVAASLALAVLLGASHALTPGHGKTVMGAYLVGSRGSAGQAVGLGVIVAVSHTLGVLGLAMVTTVAAGVIAPESLYPWLGLVSGVIVLAIGSTLVAARFPWIRRRIGHRGTPGHSHGHAHGHEQDHRHDHSDAHPHRDGHGRSPRGAPEWRGLFALGLSGGMVPSASALLLLVGSIALGRPAYGALLVLAFGLGMALVLVAIGVALVYAQTPVLRLANRLGTPSRLPFMRETVSRLAATLVLLIGIVITGQALSQLL